MALEWLVDERQVNIDIRNDTGLAPLHVAAEKGHVKVLEWLVEHGADLSAKDNRNQTALHAAAEHGHANAVDWLLHKGVDVAAVDKSGVRPAFHIAAHSGRVHILEMLAQYVKDGRVLKAFTRVPTIAGYQPKEEVTHIIKRLEKLQEVTTRKLQQAAEMDDAAATTKEASGQQIDMFLKAKKLLTWILQKLPEDTIALALAAKVDKAMATLVAGEKEGGGAVRAPPTSKQAKRKKKHTNTGRGKAKIAPAEEAAWTLIGSGRRRGGAATAAEINKQEAEGVGLQGVDGCRIHTELDSDDEEEGEGGEGLVGCGEGADGNSPEASIDSEKEQDDDFDQQLAEAYQDETAKVGTHVSPHFCPLVPMYHGADSQHALAGALARAEAAEQRLEHLEEAARNAQKWAEQRIVAVLAERDLAVQQYENEKQAHASIQAKCTMLETMCMETERMYKRAVGIDPDINMTAAVGIEAPGAVVLEGGAASLLRGSNTRNHFCEPTNGDDSGSVCQICSAGGSSPIFVRGDKGELLPCDYCASVFHLGCLSPPLHELPDGLWGCPGCVGPPPLPPSDAVHSTHSQPLQPSWRLPLAGVAGTTSALGGGAPWGAVGGPPW
jgi:hypothetical protein